MRLFIFISLVFNLFHVKAAHSFDSKEIDVVFLTQSGPQVLKQWSFESLNSWQKKNPAFEAQRFLFEESASLLKLEEKAGIDLVSIIAEHKTIRVPRHLIWRGWLRFSWDPRKKILSSALAKISQTKVAFPLEYYQSGPIRKIELSNHEFTYPDTRLFARTNPAASRGEKIFVQTCLSCHSVSSYGSARLTPEDLKPESLKNFNQVHRQWPKLFLDSRTERGLMVYSEALALEQNGVKTKK